MDDKEKRIKELEEAALELFNIAHDSDLIQNKIRANELYDVIKPQTLPIVGFTKDDMKKAFTAGARNGSIAGMRVARGGDLHMEHFEEWFPKYLDTWQKK